MNNRTRDRAEAAKSFVDDHLPHVRDALDLSGTPPGAVEVVTPLEAAVPGAWLVLIESVAEDLAIKHPLLAAVDGLADQDAILATKLSSYP